MNNSLESVIPDDFKYTGRLYHTPEGGELISFRRFISPSKNKFVDKRMFLQSISSEYTSNIIDKLIKIVEEDKRFIDTTMFYDISHNDTIHSMFPGTIISPKHCDSMYVMYDDIRIEIKVYDVFGVKYSNCNVVEITN